MLAVVSDYYSPNGLTLIWRIFPGNLRVVVQDKQSEEEKEVTNGRGVVCDIVFSS